MEASMSCITADELLRIEKATVTGLDEVAREGLRLGIVQVAELWRPEDGDAAALENFVRLHFASRPEDREALYGRFEELLEELEGHLNEVEVAFRRHSDLDTGPMLPSDGLFAAFDPGAHLAEDFFASGLAFVALLNFPLSSLEDRVREGSGWSRRRWAEHRLVQRFSRRVPGEAMQRLAAAAARAEAHVAGCNIHTHQLLDEDGRRPFPAGQRLLAHWNLRDEIRARYADATDGLPTQRMIQRVMQRIVDQSIPPEVLDNPGLDWNPFSNETRKAEVHDIPSATASREPEEANARYARLLDCFQACRAVDAHCPRTPSLVARRFEEDREIPETRIRSMLEQILTSPLVGRAVTLLKRRLDRPLEPFDIWYDGFRPRPRIPEGELDALTAVRYPDAAAFQRDLPRILGRLGFTPEKAGWLAQNIRVEAARGSGHAWGPRLRSAPARLRTRIGTAGMDYKGYNIAVHELGHNVEQVLSLKAVDHYLLHGVPGNAFSEALAFVFQARDLELLDLDQPGEKDRSLGVLDEFWVSCEISAVSLTEMEIWNWLYEHPDTDAAGLREAVIRIAREVWNRSFAEHFELRDQTLLAAYQHLVDCFLYLPDYALGHLIAFQVGRQIGSAERPGEEFERLARIGRLGPDLWMETATGSPVGPEMLLDATEGALDELETV